MPELALLADEQVVRKRREVRAVSRLNGVARTRKLVDQRVVHHVKLVARPIQVLGAERDHGRVLRRAALSDDDADHIGDAAVRKLELVTCLAAILVEEQRHTRMYRARLAADGAELGDYQVHGYFWTKVESFHSPLDFICAMSLTFENANLDHTVDYAAAARRARDEKTAGVIDQVHRDEVEHVRFGWRWLQLFKGEGESAWQAYERSLTWPLRPARARGRSFDREGRVAAGLDAEFIRRIEASRP